MIVHVRGDKFARLRASPYRELSAGQRGAEVPVFGSIESPVLTLLFNLRTDLKLVTSTNKSTNFCDSQAESTLSKL